MIKLGNAYFDPAAIESISPDPVVFPESPPCNYIVSMASGCTVETTIGEDELEAALISAGLLPSPDADEPEGIPLTEAQRHELAGLYRAGYLYMAKDINGCSYAYIDVPEKHGAYWDSHDNGKPQRLTEDYDFLAYEDDRPVFIPAVLGVPVPPAPLFTPDPEVQGGN